MEELPPNAETHSVHLGSAGSVDIPLGSLRALLVKQIEDMIHKDSDSEDELESDKEEKSIKKKNKEAKEESHKQGKVVSTVQTEMDLSKLSYD